MKKNNNHICIDNMQIKQLLNDLEDIKKIGHVYRPLVIFYENRIRDNIGGLLLALNEAQTYVDEVNKQMR